MVFSLFVLFIVPVEVFAKVKVTDVEYDTLDEAVQNVKDGEVITLLDDVDVTDKKYGAYYNWLFPDNTTLDLNGHTIITGWNKGYPSSVWLGNNLTIKNGSFKSYYKDTEDGPYLVADYALFLGDEQETSNITLENIEVNTGINIYNTLNVTMKNVTAKGKTYYAVWLDGHATATIESGNFSTEGIAIVGITRAVNDETGEVFDSELIINGGTFEGDEGTLSLSETSDKYLPPIIKGGNYDFDVSKFVSEGYKSTIVDGKVVVKKETTSGHVSYDRDVIIENTSKKIELKSDNDDLALILKNEVIYNSDIAINKRDIKIVFDVQDIKPVQNIINEVLNDKNMVISNFFEIKVDVIDKRSEEVLGNLTKLREKASVSFNIPQSLMTDKERKYYILKEYEGTVERIEPILSAEGKILTFDLDGLANYALVYEDLEDPKEIVNPGTEDMILNEVLVMFCSLLGSTISLIYFKKSKGML